MSRSKFNHVNASIMKLDSDTYEKLYYTLNDIKEAIDQRHNTKASTLCNVLIEEVRYADVM